VGTCNQFFFFDPRPHLTSPHLASPRLASPRLASPRLASPRLASPHRASRLVTPSRSHQNEYMSEGFLSRLRQRRPYERLYFSPHATPTVEYIFAHFDARRLSSLQLRHSPPPNVFQLVTRVRILT